LSGTFNKKIKIQIWSDIWSREMLVTHTAQTNTCYYKTVQIRVHAVYTGLENGVGIYTG